MPKQVPPIDDDVYAYIQAHAVPLEDDFNSALRRLLGMTPVAGDNTGALDRVEGEQRPERRSRRGRARSRPATRARAAKGSLLAEQEYELPILEALVQLGGRGPTRDVIDLVGRKLDGRLNATDRETLSSGDVRWRNRAQFVRLGLIKRGDMKADSPRGTWEITAQGERRAEAGSR